MTDLRSLFGAARNQGSRPTCVAFAVSDAHAVARGPYEELSVELLFFRATKRVPGWKADEGVPLRTALAALRLDGQCIEEGWPYLKKLPTNLAEWIPPVTLPQQHRRDSTSAAATVDFVVNALEGGNPAVVTMLLGQRFYAPVDGLITEGAEDADTAYHAVIAVGHGKFKSERVILVRNSWSAGWGQNGHAWVTETYIKPRVHAVALVSKTEMIS